METKSVPSNHFPHIRRTAVTEIRSFAARPSGGDDLSKHAGYDAIAFLTTDTTNLVHKLGAVR